MLDAGEHLVVDTTFYEDRQSGYVPQGYSIPPGPCQDCPLAERCKDEKLACVAFHEFVMRGKAKREPENPTRELFEWIFSGRDETGRWLPAELRDKKAGRPPGRPKKRAKPPAENKFEVVRGTKEPKVVAEFPTIEEARAFLVDQPMDKMRPGRLTTLRPQGRNGMYIREVRA